jgi:hypothetical protein
MVVRLAGLRLAIGGHLHIRIIPGVGSLCRSFFLCFVGLDFDEGNFYSKREKKNGLCLRLGLGALWMRSFDGTSANRRFLRKTTRNKKSGVQRQND